LAEDHRRYTALAVGARDLLAPASQYMAGRTPAGSWRDRLATTWPGGHACFAGDTPAPRLSVLGRLRLQDNSTTL